jgi:hypothetical protein
MGKAEKINEKIKKLKRELNDIDYMIRGTITKIYNRCGKSSCICHRDSGKLHGPYYSYTKKVKGKTTGFHLSKEEAAKLKRHLRGYNRAVELIRKISSLSEEALIPPPVRKKKQKKSDGKRGIKK